jgi:putative inorganic carbon (HCO3(-)) transporter
LKSLISVLNRYLVYIITFVFIAFNLWQISKDYMLLGLLPLALVFVVIAIFRLDALLIITVFFVPLSIPLRELSGGLSMDLFLPSELLLIIILFIVIFKRIKGEIFSRKLLSHPVSIAIYLNLAWLLVTSITSTMPLVSFKFFFARLWFLVAFYFLAAEIFRKAQNMNRFLWAYIITLLMVIGYTIARHISLGLFDQEAAHYVMNPFYNDHTSYGAILAMMIPVAFGFVIDRNQSALYKLLAFGILCILVIAIILSFSRAAWVSLIVSAGVFIVVILRIRFHTFFVAVIIALVFIFSQLENITFEMEKNRQQSSANLSEHVQSISNITTDDSNMERLNRWSCAWRMFLEKPILGWGPGTYMFQYAPFQVSTEKTTISTNMSDRGNAHSEYLGPLSESGLFGMLTFIAIVTMTLITGFKTYWKLKDRKQRILMLSVILGLITYYIHGIMNNFLDTDKASAPFWGYTAIIVALDVYFNNQVEDKKKKDAPIVREGKNMNSKNRRENSI